MRHPFWFPQVCGFCRSLCLRSPRSGASRSQSCSARICPARCRCRRLCVRFRSGFSPGRRHDSREIHRTRFDRLSTTSRNVVEAAGLTLDHVVYLKCILKIHIAPENWTKCSANYFPKVPPARAVLGVAKLPRPGVQITAIAVRDLKGKDHICAGVRGEQGLLPGNADLQRILLDDARPRFQNWNCAQRTRISGEPGA